MGAFRVWSVFSVYSSTVVSPVEGSAGHRHKRSESLKHGLFLHIKAISQDQCQFHVTLCAVHIKSSHVAILH